jgi:hypothetical protein
VALTHRLKGAKYLQSAKLLTITSPISAEGEPLRDMEVIDWIWQVFQIVFGDKNGKA